MDSATTVARILDDAADAGRFSAASCVVAVDAEIVLETNVGYQAVWSAPLDPIPPDQRISVSASTLFDLASITKILTAHTALSIVDQGMADLDEPIGNLLSSYREGERAKVTLRHLLSHTSGLPSEWNGWREPLDTVLAAAHEPVYYTRSPLFSDRIRLIENLLATPLVAPPGTEFLYSCAGYNTAMAYLERRTARPWHELVEQFTIAPLGLSSVTAYPDATHTASTEYQPTLGRGVICGDAHDEAAWSLGGGAGNAGLFSTARDLLSFGEAIRLGDGRVRGDWMWNDALSGVLGRPTADRDGGFGSTLGLRIGDMATMGAGSPSARSHIGFTGTLLNIDRKSGTTIVLLTNRVHPSRQHDIVDVRRQVVDVFAR